MPPLLLLHGRDSDQSILLTLHGDIKTLLRRPPADNNTISYRLNRRASIKDVLESLAIPHTEIGAIILDGQAQTFDKLARSREHYNIYPQSPASPPTTATLLRPEPLAECIFLVDINTCRLAELLRMAGFDAESVKTGEGNASVVSQAIREKRILLTRNRDLLKLRNLIFGRLVRSQVPEQQLKEIVELYGLTKQIRPLSRCISCNGRLKKVEKEEVIQFLQPLTKKYFDHFNQCVRCGKIYWHGSHCDKMTTKLRMIFDEGL